MTKANTTDLTIVLDRSGSMANIAADMKGGFDTFIKEQQKVRGDCRVTLIQFDDPDHVEVVYTAKPVSEVPPLVLEPRGSTALLDAMARAIQLTGERLRAMKERDRPSQVLLMVITDGHENASKEHGGPAGRKRVFDMVEHQRSVYSWEYVYLGANQDAIAAAQDIGIHSNAVNYVASAAGAQAAFSTASSSVTQYRHTGDALMGNMINQAGYDQALANIQGGGTIQGGTVAIPAAQPTSPEPKKP